MPSDPPANALPATLPEQTRLTSDLRPAPVAHPPEASPPGPTVDFDHKATMPLSPAPATLLDATRQMREEIASAEGPVSVLLLRWQEQREQGITLSAEQLCQDCPEYREEVERRLRRLIALQGFLAREEPNREAPSPKKSSSRSPVVPGYEIQRELGHGGMGIVYQARQIKLNRIVALKMILAGGRARDQDLARFRIEGEAVARLQHPNIVQVFEVGEAEGCPFFSLEFCPGGCLADHIKGKPFPAARAAQLVATLARAMQAAHQQHVVHRDLKPANVLLSADGQPKITDFGLAKKLDEVGQKQTGHIMGSPPYMAPEQAAGRLKEIGPVTDVYGLSAILYELLTGRPPFQAESAWDTIDLVLNQEPVPPSRLQPKAPRDLETICLKGLEKDPPRRYPSAGELADDLDRFLKGEPIRARPPSVVEQVLKWARRRPTQAALAGTFVLAMLASLASAVLYLQNTKQQAEHKQREAEYRQQQEERSRHVDRLWYQGQLAETRGQAALGRGAEDEAAQEFTEADKKFGEALGALQAESAAGEDDREEQIEQARERVRRHLSERNTRQALLRKSARFLEDRDQVLFYETNVTGRDQAFNQEQVRRLAPTVLAPFSLGLRTPPAEAAQALDPYRRELRMPQRAQQLAAGCYEVLLLWAEAVADAPPDPKAAGRDVSARQALHLLRLADALGQAYELPTPQVYELRKARYLAQAGEDCEAVAERDRAARLDPNTPLDHWLAALDAYRRKDTDRAESACGEVLRQQSDHFWARYLQALCWMRTERWNEAHVGLTACVGRRPDFLWPLLLRASTDVERKKFKEAEADFADALKLARAPFDRYVVLTNRSALRIRQGRWQDARDDLNDAIRLQPDAYQAYLNLAQVHKARREWDAACTAMDQALVRAPGNANLYHTRAEIQLERGDLAAARRDFEEAIAREPKGQRSERLASDYVELGHLRHRAGAFKEALADGGAALAIWPNYPPAHLLRAKSWQELGLHAETVKERNHHCAEAGRELDLYLGLVKGEAKADVYKARGVIYQGLGEDARALVAFTQALNRQEEAESFSLRGWTHLRLGSPAAALPDFEEALKRDSSSPYALYGRGQAHVLQGRVAEAIRDAEKALHFAQAADTERHRAARLLLNAACIYARAAVQLLTQDRSFAGEEQAYRYEQRAVDLLDAALKQVPEKERSSFWRKYVRHEAGLRSLQLRTDMRSLAKRFGQ
jgi:serine/threonine protein kinase/tetratricopeptide (TPR) repeat protein